MDAAPNCSYIRDMATMTRNGTLRLDSKIQVFEDRESKADWRVEYVDDDGGCYVTIFAGPFAEKRAREYAEALTARKLAPIQTAQVLPRNPG